ncbi:permease [Candidatus Dojkabacteria bacterium]|nr:permease [Candidatus Dojkabacteria bacterium]
MDIFSPIEYFADTATYQLLRFAPNSYWGEAVHFFIYDTIKISLLLIVIGYIMAITRYYLALEKVRDLISNQKLRGLDYFFAAVLGVITPFCSCSSIPLFLGFVGAGIPMGVTFAFLISSPLVNEASLYMFPALFGWKITLLYNLMGIAVAIIGGMIIQKLKVERFLKPEIRNLKTRKQVECENGGKALGLKDLIIHFWREGLSITKEIIGYVIFGVGVGALIHGFVPTAIVEQYASSREWWTVPIATFIGAPLYANSVSILPVMEALIAKGLPVGTVLAFMTGVVTISIPQTLILKKVMGWKPLAIFLGITITGIMIMGYTFNAVF